MSRPATERAELLDALRGFALLGVVLANFAFFAQWVFLGPDQRAALPGAWFDGTWSALHTVFVDGKFYSLFSLLFGIGFGLQMERGAGSARFLRRMFVLLVIGALHLRFVWEGDILFLYAVLGFLLPLFARVRERTLVVIAALLLLAPIALDTARVLSDGAFDPAAPIRAAAFAADEAAGFGEDTSPTYLADGGWREFANWQSGAWLWRFMQLVDSNRLPKVLAMFLLGLAVARAGLHRDPARHAALFKRTARFGFALGLPMSVVLYWSEHVHARPPAAESLVTTTAYALSVAPLALAYASSFALLWTNERARARLLVFAPVGRMALTNYLGQTVLALLLFTGLGAGLGARSSALVFTALALLVFAAQLVASRWWLSRFRFGPLEWLWRMATYGERIPLRRA